MSRQTKEPAKEVATRTVVEAPGPTDRVVFRVAVIVVTVVIGAIALWWVISRLTGILLLLVLSIFFAYLVAPLVEFLRRPMNVGSRTVAMPKALAILLAYLTIAIVAVVAVYFVLPSLTNQYPEFANQAKEYWASLSERSKSVIEYSRSGRIPPRVVEEINNAVPKVVEKVSTVATEFATSALAYLVLYIPWIILIPILAFFLLKDAESFRRSALLMLPRGRWRWRGDEFFQDINNTLAAYIRAQLTACLFIGVVCAIGFTLLGLPGGLVMGVIAGVFEFVPLVGPVTVALMAAILAMLHAGPFNAFLVLLFLGVLRIVQDYAIYPRLIGQGIHLHPLAVIFAILAGEKLGGVPGVFLAIPLVAILTVSYRHWLEHHGNEGLADLLEPAPAVAVIETTPVVPTEKVESELHSETTPEQMVRHRPDLTTGELKMPVEE